MSQVIVRRPAGKKLPADFISLVIEKCPSAWGVSILADGKLELNQGTGATLELVQGTLKDFADNDITFYFQADSGGTNLNTVPPYPIITNEDEEPIVALFADGEFPGFAKKDSSFPASYHLGIELMNTLFETYELLDKDLDQFMKKIASESYRKKMNLHSVGRGYITVVAINGGAVTFAQGDTAGDIEGGCWASNTFGYGKVEKPADEKPKSMFPSMSGKSTVREKHVPPSNAVQAAGADKPAKTAETAVKAEGGNNPKPPEPPKPVVLTLENITVSKVKIPGHYSRKNRRGWIKDRIGYVPPTTDNTDQVYQVYTSPNGTTLMKKEIERALGLSAAKLPKLDNPQPTGKTESQHIDPDRSVTTNPLPILSPTARVRINNFISDERIKKIIGENAEMITDPERVQGYEGKIVPVNEQLGWKDMHDLDCMPFPELQKIAHASFNDITVLANEWRRRALLAEFKLLKLEKKQPKAEAEAPATVVETPRRSAFPSMRRAG